MKKQFLALSLVLGFGSAAFARDVVYKVDMTRDFSDNSFNQWSIAEDTGNWPASFAFTVPAKKASDVKVQTELADTSIRGDKCQAKVKNVSGKIQVIVAASLDVDSNSCEVEIQLESGRTANIHIENVGT